MEKSTELAKFIQREGLEVLEDNAQWRNRFGIKSESSDNIYIVAQNKKTGEFGCSCPGWRRHRKCKHLTTLKPLIDTVGK